MSQQARQPRRRSQAERTALSDERLINAALELIAQQGFSRTTLAQIGERAGYSAALVSHRFGSKQGLLQTLVARVSGRFLAERILPAMFGRSGLDALYTMIDVYFGEVAARQKHIRAMYVLMGETLGPVADVRPVFAALNRDLRDGARAWIEAGMARGEIRSDIDASVEAAVVIAMMRGVALQWLTEPDCIDLDSTGAAVKSYLRDRLAAVKPPPPHDPDVARR